MISSSARDAQTFLARSPSLPNVSSEVNSFACSRSPAFSRQVDAIEADGDRPTIAHDRDGVPVGQADDLPGEALLGGSRKAPQDEHDEGKTECHRACCQQKLLPAWAFREH